MHWYLGLDLPVMYRIPLGFMGSSNYSNYLSYTIWFLERPSAGRLIHSPDFKTYYAELETLEDATAFKLAFNLSE